jgi:hypothetical protein
MFWTAPLSVTILLILIPSSDAWIVATSFIAGAIKPPLGITFRSGWMRIAPEKPLRPAAYSLESLTIPFSTAIGSFIAGALLFIGPEAVLIFVCLSTLIGSVAMIFHPATSPMPQELEVLKYDPSSQESSSFELSSPGLGKKTWVVLIAVALSWALLVGAEMSVGVTYGAQELAWASGFSTLALVIGSLAVTYNLERSSYSYTMLGLAIAAASMILMSFIVTYSLLLAIVGMVLLGAGRGMVSAAGSSSISETAPVSRVSEAMGLYASGLLLSQTSYRSLAPLLASPAAIAAAPALVGFLFWIFYRKEDE